MKRAIVAAGLCFVLAAGCAPPAPVDDGGVDGGPSADAGTPDALAVLDDVDDVALLAGEAGAVKYLLPVASAAPRAPIEDCAFQNTTLYPFHIQYLRAQPGSEELTYDEYIALVLVRATRAWWGGEVAWDAARAHPLTGAAGVLAFQLYTQDTPGDRLLEQDVRDVHAALVVCAPAFADALAFAPVGNEQRGTAAAVQESLAADGIAVLLQ
jgi:hypothetical protein